MAERQLQERRAGTVPADIAPLVEHAVYVPDSEYPYVDTPEEAIAALRDQMWPLRAIPVDLGEPVRNEPACRWEVPVGGWLYVDERSAVLQHPAQAWQVVGAIEPRRRRWELQCDCCLKAAEELLVIAVLEDGYRGPRTSRALYQVDIRHVARRLGRSVDQLRAEQAERHRQVAKQFLAAQLGTCPDTDPDDPEDSGYVVTAAEALLCTVRFPDPKQALAAAAEIIRRCAAGEPIGPGAAEEVAGRYGGRRRWHRGHDADPRWF
jgi:hypothetical protein